MSTNIIYCTELDSINRHWGECLSSNHKGVKQARDFDSVIALMEKFPESVVIIHLSSCKGDIFKKMGEIVKSNPKCKILALSDIPAFAEGKRLMQIGVKGYGNSRLAAVHMIQAVEYLSSGNLWVYPEFIQQMIKDTIKPSEEPSVDLSPLTKREKEIAYLIAQGLSNRDIAESINISERTVKAHLSSVYDKLNLNDRLSLALLFK